MSLLTKSTRPEYGNSRVARNPQKEEKERRVVLMKPLWLRDAAKIILIWIQLSVEN